MNLTRRPILAMFAAPSMISACGGGPDETPPMLSGSAGAQVSKFKPDTHCSLDIYFEVQDGQVAAFKALGLTFIERTRGEGGCLYYGYTFNGNICHSREGYINADSLLSHLESINGIVGEALAISTIVRLEVHAPAAELEKLRDPLSTLNPTFYALEPGGICGHEALAFKTDSHCALAVYFEVLDGQVAAFKALGLTFIERTRTESGALYYAYSFSGNICHSREGYTDADSVLAHLESINGIVGQALAISKIVRVEMHAPAAELEKLRGPLSSLNPTLYTLEPGGISRVG